MLVTVIAVAENAVTLAVRIEREGHPCSVERRRGDNQTTNTCTPV
jgi:hypothetical protein